MAYLLVKSREDVIKECLEHFGSCSACCDHCSDAGCRIAGILAFMYYKAGKSCRTACFRLAGTTLDD